MKKCLYLIIGLIFGFTSTSCDSNGIEEGDTAYLTDGVEIDTLNSGTTLYLLPAATNNSQAMLTWDRYHFAGDANFVKYTGNIVIPETVLYKGSLRQITEIDSYTFALSTGLSSISIPATVSTIGKEAFIGCTRLTTLALPDILTAIPDGMCGLNTKLKTFTIPAAIKSIGKKAFINCSSLSKIDIPDTCVLTSIGDYAYFGCSGLTTFNIPSTVTAIGAYAFSNCSKLTTIHCKATTPPTLTDSISTNNPVLYVPKGSKSAYQANTLWNKFNTINEE